MPRGLLITIGVLAVALEVLSILWFLGIKIHN